MGKEASCIKATDHHSVAGGGGNAKLSIRLDTMYLPLDTYLKLSA